MNSTMILPLGVALCAISASGALAQNRASLTELPEGSRVAYAPVIAGADCAALAHEAFDGITHLATSEETGEAGPFCRIQGIIHPEIQFEIALPQAWNRRLYMFGNGGYAGEDLNDPARLALRDAALARGFMTVQQNTGHDARTYSLGDFADGSLSRLVDYAHRAVHETVVAAKTIAQDYYDQSPAYSYWDGCSTGGRQGLMAAQRYPGDFDGIVAGAPVLDFTGTQLWGIYNAQQLDRAPISSAQLPVLARAVMAACDATDGLEDGLISDPRQCEFNPANDLLRCEGGAGDDCFTEDQIGAIQAIADGVQVDGETVFPGVPWGVEGMAQDQSGWNLWIVSDDGPSRQLAYGDTFLRNMALLPTRGTDLDWREFDIAGRYGEIGMIRDILDATDPDLSAFKQRGGKMITYFGWADPALNPMMGVNYYEDVRETMGIEETEDFYRLFMVPGMFHCRAGYGPDTFDALTPLIEWVENGQAPDQILASQMQDGTATRTRPLCPYPQVAVHDGSGDPDAAASFTCEAPTEG